jgi:chromosome segregation protein
VFLKSLTLKGFKSFAETTVLDFEPGVTVVVGPNGSGKSNVVDAIGWVLGAQSPKTVRSQKMDDVIFAGTTKRQALGRAEVALTIDNSAGLLPIDFTEVTISRTLFRTGDSEYAINGVPCRLLDITDLLSDSGVGRQQHVIVSQGQIDAVLNARPEERRLIIEEAAGVLKYRKRKEKSERRLAATEANLTRLQDLLREVRRQLRPLERQADAARRHGALVTELGALRIFLAGRELDTLQKRMGRIVAERTTHTDAEAVLRKRLSELDTSVMQAEAELAAIGGDDLGDVLGGHEGLRERARGLMAVLTERRRGVERERGVTVDAAVIASLEAEAARLTSELAAADNGAAALVPDLEQLAEREATLTEARQAFEAQWADGAPIPTGEASEVRGELGALRSGVERADEELERARSRLAVLTAKDERLGAEAQGLRRVLADADATEAPLVASQAEAEAAVAAGTAAADAAEEARRKAEAEAHRWIARADALELALEQARSKAGAERLTGVAGVVGTLLDLVEVDDGWEAAFEAAAADALSAVVVESTASGRQAIEALRSDDTSGSIVALGAELPDRSAPAVGTPLRPHVRATRPDVDRLLDGLIGHVTRIDGDWKAAVDASLSHPGAVVVTAGGDRFSAEGWRVGLSGSGATGAALAEAQERADDATSTAAVAVERSKAARDGLAAVVETEREVSAHLDAVDGERTAAGEALQRIEADRREASTEIESLRGHVSEVTDRLDSERARIAELEDRLPILHAAEADAADSARAMATAREQLDERNRAVNTVRADLELRAAGLDDRRQFLQRRLTEVEARLEGNRSARDEAAERRVGLDARLLALDALSVRVAEAEVLLEDALGRLRRRRQAQTEVQRTQATALDGYRRARTEAEHELEEVRERLRRAEIEETELKLRVENAVETMRRDLDIDPAGALEAECPELEEGVAPAARARELERELRLMGPINPLALEEYEALQERHEFVQGQLDDVKSSRRELAKVIRAIDEEIVHVFAAAFADVSQNFEHLFATLFPGGEGRLKLTEPDSLLDTGIEVEAKPSGKNVRKLSLLSGGERSLTALAFLFAVFRSRPSPFYVMDEVEAALDDVNLHRFLDLVHEFRQEAQLLIVSHQKRTMEAADCLYGITMQPGGSSRAVSEKTSVA